MKKETLEEAAEKYINDDLDLYESLVDGHISYNIGIDLLNKLFIAGAKYQAERMYSEEDLRKAIQLARLCTLDGNIGEFVDLTGLTEVCTYGLKETHSEDLIIEQFKKK